MSRNRYREEKEKNTYIHLLFILNKSINPLQQKVQNDTVEVAQTYLIGKTSGKKRLH